MVLLQDVIRVHTGVESTVVIRQVPSADSDSMRTVLRESRLHTTSRFFVHLSSTDTALFLKAVIYIHTLLSLSAQNISHLTHNNNFIPSLASVFDSFLFVMFMQFGI